MDEAPKVLVTDDDELNRKFFARVLERARYQVVFATSGRESLEVARREKPALILMDLLMPDMDGTEAVAALKQDPETAHIPVIAMTARRMEEVPNLAGDSRFADAVTKPVDIESLLSMIRRIIHSAG